MALFQSAVNRSDPTEDNILPETIGLNASGKGSRWTIGEVTKRGDEVARQLGYVKPSSAERIRYGLLEAARLNPLMIPDAKVPLLVKSALFNVDPAAANIDAKFHSIVTERALEAIYNHLDDDADQFRQWFLGPKSSFVHQIAKKKRSRGGQLNEDEVRNSLLRLGWDAYEYVSGCISLQMQAVAQAMPADMTEKERMLFEQMHLPQRYLGNLPLVLLVERFGFIGDVLWEIWQDMPNDRLISILHRLLDYYSIMATRRREADRRMKQPKAQTLIDNIHGRTEKKGVFHDIADHLREKQEISCKCRGATWNYRIEDQSEQFLTIECHCENCDVKKLMFVSLDRFKQAGSLFIESPENESPDSSATSTD